LVVRLEALTVTRVRVVVTSSHLGKLCSFVFRFSVKLSILPLLRKNKEMSQQREKNSDLLHDIFNPIFLHVFLDRHVSGKGEYVQVALRTFFVLLQKDYPVLHEVIQETLTNWDMDDETTELYSRISRRRRQKQEEEVKIEKGIGSVASSAFAEHVNIIKDFNRGKRGIKSYVWNRVKRRKYTYFAVGYHGHDKGHAIGALVHSRSNDTYDVIITNSGDGLPFHPTHTNTNDDGKKNKKYHVIWKIPGLEKSQMEEIMAWLIYCERFETWKRENLEIGQETRLIYGFLKEWLKQEQLYEKSAQKEDFLLRPAQQGGSCTFFSTYYMLFYMLGTESKVVTFNNAFRQKVGVYLEEALERFIDKKSVTTTEDENQTKDSLWLCRLYMENKAISNSKLIDRIWLYIVEAEAKLRQSSYKGKLSDIQMKITPLEMDQNRRKKIPERKILSLPRSISQCIQSHWLETQMKNIGNTYDFHFRITCQRVLLQQMLQLPVETDEDRKTIRKDNVFVKLIQPWVSYCVYEIHWLEKRQRYMPELNDKTNVLVGFKWMYFLILIQIQDHFKLHILKPFDSHPSRRFDDALYLFRYCSFLLHEFSQEQVERMLIQITPYMYYVPVTYTSFMRWKEIEVSSEYSIPKLPNAWKIICALNFDVNHTRNIQTESDFESYIKDQVDSTRWQWDQPRIFTLFSGLQSNPHMKNFFKIWNAWDTQFKLHTVVLNPYSSMTVNEYPCPVEKTEHRVPIQLLKTKCAQLNDEAKVMVETWQKANVSVSDQIQFIGYVLYMSFVTFSSWTGVQQLSCLTFLSLLLKQSQTEEEEPELEFLKILVETLLEKQPYSSTMYSRFIGAEIKNPYILYLLESYQYQFVHEYMFHSKANITNIDVQQWLKRFQLISSDEKSIILLPRAKLDYDMFQKRNGFVLDPEKKMTIFPQIDYCREGFHPCYYYAKSEQFPNVDLWICDNDTYELYFVDRKTGYCYLDENLTEQIVQDETNDNVTFFRIDRQILTFYNSKSRILTIRNYGPPRTTLRKRHDVQFYLDEKSYISKAVYKDKQVMFPIEKRLRDVPFTIRRWFPNSVYWVLFHEETSNTFSLGFFADRRGYRRNKQSFKTNFLFGKNAFVLPDAVNERFYEIPLSRYGIDSFELSSDHRDVLHFLLDEYFQSRMYDEASHLLDMLHKRNWTPYPHPYYLDGTTGNIEEYPKSHPDVKESRDFSFFDSRLNLFEKLLKYKTLKSEWKHPLAAVFEQLSGFSIYDRQWEIIQTILKQWKDKKEFRPIHLLMGQGKSKVIMPLLVLYILFQEKKHAVLVVPSHLLRATIQDMQRLFQSTLRGHWVYPNKEETKYVLKDMKKSISNHIWVVSDDQLKKQFIRWVQQSKPDRIEYVRNQCVFLCDEIDTLMNPMTNVLQQPNQAPVSFQYLKELSRFAWQCLQSIKSSLKKVYMSKQNPTLADVLQWRAMCKIDSQVHAFQSNTTLPISLRYGYQQLKQRFSAALLMIYNVQYGWAEYMWRIKIVPYRGLHKPVDSAVYSDPYLMIWLTWLTSIYTGYRARPDNHHLMEYLESRIQFTSNEQLQKETISDWMKLFQWTSIRDVNVENIHKKQSVLEENYSKYIFDVVLPVTTRFTPSQINVSFLDVSNQHTFMKYKCGFSGTYVPYQYEYYENNKKQEFGLPLIDVESTREIESVLSHPELLRYDIEWEDVVQDYDVLIDACSKFKIFTPFEMVQKMNTFQHKRYAFVYFDEQDNRMYYLSKEKTTGEATNTWLEKCRKEKKSLFLYYDQGHTVGTDIPQTGNEKGLITFDHTCAFNTFAQAAFRLRHLTGLKNKVPQTLHVWIERSREPMVSFDNQNMTDEKKSITTNEKESKDYEKKSKTNQKKRFLTLPSKDDEPTSKKQKTEFDLLSFLRKQQDNQLERAQHELALQNLKYLKRVESKYNSVELLEDETIYEWTENPSRSIIRDIQKAYRPSSSDDLSNMYQIEFYCGNRKYPSSLCVQLSSRYQTASYTKSVITQNVSIKEETKQNVSTLFSMEDWTPPTSSFIPVAKWRYFENSSEDNHLPFVSDYTFWKLSHHHVPFFQSRKNREIQDATLSHNLFWKEFPWYLLSTPSNETLLIITEEEMCELVPYLPSHSNIVDKEGRSIRTGQTDQQIVERKDWPLFQCLTGHTAGLAHVLTNSLFQKQVMNYYEMIDMTYLEIYRIVAYFSKQKTPYVLDNSFFDAIAFPISHLDRDTAQKSIYDYYSQLLKIK
jgi:hypothetical protein